MFIFLDESGDLGFDWSKPGTSPYFTITLLVCDSPHVVRNFRTAVKRTLRHKLNTKASKRQVMELKGSQTTIEVKRYFHRHAPEGGWALYISHESSQENPCLQAVDLFCWGIARKRRDNDGEWYNEFAGKVRADDFYLPPLKKR